MQLILLMEAKLMGVNFESSMHVEALDMPKHLADVTNNSPAL